MLTKKKKVIVFVSSTFLDMHAERDYLVTVVFPQLRERIEGLGIELFDVDLRWGVPEWDAEGEKANSWEYCKKSIDGNDGVIPYFVCILGQRYGSVPDIKDFKSNEDKIRQALAPRSITDLEVRYTLIDEERKRHSYFYIRETDVPIPELSDKTAVKIVSEYVDPPPLQNRLMELKAKVNVCGRPVRYYTCHWTGINFTDFDCADKNLGTMILDDLWSAVLRDERYVSKEDWYQALGSNPEENSIYTNETQPIPPDIWEKIVEITKPTNPLDEELENMKAFASSRLRWFTCRTTELKQLTNFLQSSETSASRLAIISDMPGKGKSAIIAKLWELMLSNQSAFVIAHFVGVTEHSTDARSVVLRLLEELDRSGIVWPNEISQEKKINDNVFLDLDSLSFKLAQRLENYNGKRKIILLLDALNQLTDGQNLNWLPYRLGPSVRVIVSCIDNPEDKEDSPERMILLALNRRHPISVPLKPLIPDDIRSIVKEYLIEYSKELENPQIEAICNMPQAQNPLYLLVMLNELRALGGKNMNNIVKERIAMMQQNYSDNTSLFCWVLEGLENAYGYDFVSHWCSYLELGRIGMASHELRDLLKLKLGNDGFAQALRIERGLRRYLQRKGSQLDFFHGQLRKAVEYRYLDNESLKQQAHTDIGIYFRDKAKPNHEKQWNNNAIRPLSQVAYHQIHTGQVRMAENLLCDLSYGSACAQAGLLDILMSDISEGKKLLNSSSIIALNDVSLHITHALRSRPDLFVNLIVNELSSKTLPEPLQSYCNHARINLDASGVWLYAPNTLANLAHHWQNTIVKVYPKQNLVYCIDHENGDLLICKLESQQVLIRHKGFGRFKTAINPLTGVVAIVKQDHILELDSYSTGLTLRTKALFLEFFGNGIIFINNNDQLVWLSYSQEKSAILADFIPKSVCHLTSSLDGKSAVVLAGDWNENQKVFIISEVVNDLPVCKQWSTTEVPLTAACVDSSGKFLVMVTLSRKIILLDITDTSEKARTSLVSLPGRPLDLVIACDIILINGQFNILLADIDGSVCYWEVGHCIRRIGRYKTIQSEESLIAIQWLGEDNKLLRQEKQFLISTSCSLIFSSTQKNIEPHNGSAISSCSLSADDWITLTMPLDHKIVWFNPANYKEEFFHLAFTPHVVACNGKDGAVLVGAQTNLIIMKPGRKTIPDDGLMLFDQPIVSVFPWQDNSSVAISSDGEAKLVKFAPESLNILHPAKIHWKQHGACLINSEHGIVSWGRSIADSAKSRLFVIRKNGTIESILECSELIHSVSPEASLPEINVAVGNSVHSYRYECGQWWLTTSRQAVAKHLVSYNQEYLVVALIQNWIEIWRRSDLETITSAYVQEQITCLACSPPNIVAGTNDGHHLRLFLHSM